MEKRMLDMSIQGFGCLRFVKKNRKCGECEKHCPQNIQIRRELDNARRKLENPIFHIADLGCKFIFRRSRKKKTSVITLKNCEFVTLQTLPPVGIMKDD